MESKLAPLPKTTGVAHAPTVVISNIWPSVEAGRYPIKRVAGEPLEVWADIFRDGHGKVEAVLKWRRKGIAAWEETRMRHLENDRWSASCRFLELGEWEYTIESWQDDFKTWLHDFERKFEALPAGESLATEIVEGSIILEDSAKIAEKAGNLKDAADLRDVSRRIYGAPPEDVLDLVLAAPVYRLMTHWSNRELSTTAAPHHRVTVERERARFSSWYEFFPRSAEGLPGKHSRLRDCLDRIHYAKDLGFDVVYFPPIHPIGKTFRKGKDNSLLCGPEEPGSPWAIGGEVGGHYAVHPELGTVEDFEWLVRESAKIGIEIALDFAINCSPDHPYVRDHPEWFFQRPDGTIKYAENPPKKYQDIYPLNFHCEDWRALWREMVEIVLFWASKGVRIFRVDNPHTKPVAFWEYLIAEVRSRHPDVIMLAEAFTRPRMMEMLGKIGFAQSYSYFTWRTTRHEITQYVTELTQPGIRDYFRANFWPNTPDILTPPLIDGPPAAFKIRACLAATLMPSWGIYCGFEFCENRKHPDRDEYLDNEKYQLKERDWDKPGHIKAFIRRLNHIRRTNPAFEEYHRVRFLDSENERLIAWIKSSADGSNAVAVVVNLDPYAAQSGHVEFPLDLLGAPLDGRPFRIRDLAFDDVYTWKGSRNWVSLNPVSKPVHIFRIEP